MLWTWVLPKRDFFLGRLHSNWKTNSVLPRFPRRTIKLGREIILGSFFGISLILKSPEALWCSLKLWWATEVDQSLKGSHSVLSQALIWQINYKWLSSQSMLSSNHSLLHHLAHYLKLLLVRKGQSCKPASTEWASRMESNCWAGPLPGPTVMQTSLKMESPN